MYTSLMKLFKAFTNCVQCFMEPLKEVQVEGRLMFAEPHDLFGNLDEVSSVRVTILNYINCLQGAFIPPPQDHGLGS